ncbi:WD domain, G-beta repeat, putative [Trypanosoma equiperdum]|uniref:Cleavage stimulation factor 50 kDa subunit n=2 Tax=Trypanozoon TaxID=39700 RepID=Q387U0_TRYB2|nr:hypothetical protein, conserved [Trypanosoma brucei brucei TREU927]EAN78932.1 hypothetical protein, conserved [Trypanosoma brucei brucei TREU927]SCU70331.1 WD domain, G-beta repeat, putative [Trypanosoma equiperdum]
MSGENLNKSMSAERVAGSLSVGHGVDHGSRKRARSICLKQNFSRLLYQMVIRQLHHDGFLAAASAVADATNVVVPRLEENADRLSKVVSWGLAVEESSVVEIENFFKFEVVERYLSASRVYMPLHLSESARVGSMAYRMRERFITSSLGGVVRRLAFSSDGSLIACGGTDGLCAIFSLNTIEDLSALEEVRQEQHFNGLDGSNPSNIGVGNASNKITELAEARRFHEHTHSVEAISFHPTKQLLVTGGFEGDLYIRDYSQPDNHVVHKLRDAFPVRSAVFHPSGEYVLYATDHTTPRLLNLRSGSVVAPVAHSDNAAATCVTAMAGGKGVARGASQRKGCDAGHAAALCDVDFSPDGRTFASCGLDGSLIVYDGVSSRIVAKVNNAHSSVPVTSVKFSRTGNILLTAGMDSVARLWDLRRGDGGWGCTEVMSFGEPGKCNHRSFRASFSCNESHVLSQDTSLFAIHAHCVYTGDTSYTLTVPNHMQRGFAPAPFSNVVVSGGDDSRMRLWTPAWTTA